MILDTQAPESQDGQMLAPRFIDLSDIEPPPPHPHRRDEGPLVVRRAGNGFVVVRGHAAYQRAERRGVSHVACLERRDEERNDPLETLAEIALLGGHGPLEEAEAMHQAMQQLGLSQHDLAARTGLRQPHISKRLALLRLTPRDRRLLLDGRISLDEARRRAAAAARRPQNARVQNPPTAA